MITVTPGPARRRTRLGLSRSGDAVTTTRRVRSGSASSPAGVPAQSSAQTEQPPERKASRVSTPVPSEMLTVSSFGVTPTMSVAIGTGRFEIGTGCGASPPAGMPCW